MGKFNYVTLVAVVGIGLGVYVLSPGTIRFRSYSAAEFTQQLTPLFLVALLIERSLEVFLTAWRGGRAAALDRTVKAAKALAAADPARLPDVHEAAEVLGNYQSATQQIAMTAALVLGILISAIGVRALGPLVDPNAMAKLPAAQGKFFGVMDVLMTGSLVGGGSDFVHKFITTLTTFMDSTSQKAKA